MLPLQNTGYQVFSIQGKQIIKRPLLFLLTRIGNNISSFFNCTNTIEFWNSLKNWVQRQAYITLNLKLRNILFSKQVDILMTYVAKAEKIFIEQTFIKCSKC